MKSKIIVEVKGGMIQQVYYNGSEDIEVDIMDFDLLDFGTEDDIDHKDNEFEISRLQAESHRTEFKKIF